MTMAAAAGSSTFSTRMIRGFHVRGYQSMASSCSAELAKPSSDREWLRLEKGSHGGVNDQMSHGPTNGDGILASRRIALSVRPRCL